jgi:hypothetical protein
LQKLSLFNTQLSAQAVSKHGLYAIAMTEDLHQLSKVKPMVLGSALIWLAIFVYNSVEYGTAKNVAVGL